MSDRSGADDHGAPRHDAGAMHKHAAPRVEPERAREALAAGHELRAHAEQLGPVHSRRARRSRRWRGVRRWLLVLLLVLLIVVAVVAVARLLPLADWWDSVTDASTEG